DDALAYCRSVVRTFPSANRPDELGALAAQKVMAGSRTGGSTSADSEMATLQMGSIASGIHTGGRTNPEIFVSGTGHGYGEEYGQSYGTEFRHLDDATGDEHGTILPAALVFVNGGQGEARKWDSINDGPYTEYGGTPWIEVSIGYRLHEVTQWNLSDAYYVNNWPGTPYTNHKGNGDSAYHYVTQVNYITGYICAASLH
ncbi:hypothetical protein L4G50_004894, partial [Salmonella enterica]|nr:hypothetical protein [Salmonella enterica]